MTVPMTPYLERICTRLVELHRLRRVRDDQDQLVWCRKSDRRRAGGKKNFVVRHCRAVLTYHKASGFMDFQVQTRARTYVRARFVREEIERIDPHFTVNASGSIRRLYRHDGSKVARVRTISLKNYYLLKDDELARLVMQTRDDLKWLHELPVMFHPVSNSELDGLRSFDDLLKHFSGADVTVPRRLRRALAPGELLVLIQIVPGAYLNDLAATLKSEARYIGPSVTVQRLLLAYYRRSLSVTGKEVYHIVYSYVNACRALRTRLNMRVKSLKRLDEERNRMLRRRMFDMSPEVLRTHRDFWQVSKGATPGDVLLMYRCAPCSAITDIFRFTGDSVARAAADWREGDCYGGRIRRICHLDSPLFLKDMRRHKVLKTAPFIRRIDQAA